MISSVHGGAAENVPTLQREDFLACFCEVSGVDQAVVAAADHDYVIVLRHSARLAPR